MCRHKRTFQKVRIWCAPNFVNTWSVSRSSKKILEVQPNIQYIKREPTFLGKVTGLTFRVFYFTGLKLTPLRFSISCDNAFSNSLTLTEIHRLKVSVFPNFQPKSQSQKFPWLSVIWFMRNTELKLILESIVITIMITIKHLMFVCCIVVDESGNLIILYEVDISEAQLSDKNQEVPRGRRALPWSQPAAG